MQRSQRCLKVWNGSAFVSVLNIAHFVGDQQRWLPLPHPHSIGACSHRITSLNSCELWSLGCTACSGVMVRALEWSSPTSSLFIGGTFDIFDGQPLSAGFIVWSQAHGLLTVEEYAQRLSPFPVTAGTGLRRPDGLAAVISHIV